MKCPKCGYVGFEMSDRCRHCGYDFSFAASAPHADTSGLAGTAAAPALDPPLAAPRGVDDVRTVAAVPPTDRVGAVALAEPAIAGDGPLVDLPLSLPYAPELFPAAAPPPARPPLAVRRSGERPRSRPTTQVIRRPAASLLDAAQPADAATTAASTEPEAASIVRRAAAGMLDAMLLAAIGLAVVYLTVRFLGLSMDDVALLPVVPLGAFLLGFAAAYLMAFTACGGQTLGKMALGVRVVADGGAVPPGTAAIRALVALAGAALGGAGYLPILFDRARRGAHDRLAGTLVVRV